MQWRTGLELDGSTGRAGRRAAVAVGSHLSMEYAVLYTFSTIPQTLGAAFAVLAAFVIYRFQDDPAVTSAIDELLQMFTGPDQSRLSQALRDDGLKRLLAEMDQLFDTNKATQPTPGHQHNVLTWLRVIADQPDIKGPLKRAFIWTAAVIVVSVIALCFEKPLAACTACAVAALCLGVAGLARCMWLYWKLIEPLISSRRW